MARTQIVLMVFIRGCRCWCGAGLSCFGVDGFGAGEDGTGMKTAPIAALQVLVGLGLG